MNETYQTILRSIERMFKAIDMNIDDGKFYGTTQTLDIIKDFIEDIKRKSPYDKQVEINSIVTAQINYIRMKNRYIPDFLNNKLNEFIN